ncbi:CCCH zinc finger protein [Phlyctema vagabunda]|uniref:CCCH zinc finger protein n=1 Tax=Phlyctema vagabunda TaxID=108571 RepID=A0ABR4P5S3_9HELO
MAAEDRDILAKISQLAGQINRHKNTQQPADPQMLHRAPYPASSSTWTAARGSYTRPAAGRLRGAYPGSSGYRGGRSTQVHRHRTLVLNGSTTNEASEPSPQSANDSNQQATPSWISKTDRHMQLIHPSVYEKNTQSRARAIEQTKNQKLRQRDEREKLKLIRHLQRGGVVPALKSGESHQESEINVQGIRFQVAKDSSKLVKVPGKTLLNGRPSTSWSRLLWLGDTNSANATPKTALVGGVRFHRSKNGNLYRAGVVKAQRRSGVVKKINEPCKMFATTGCCLKGPRCRYIHDASKVAVCKVFLQKGSCPSGDSCDLSHDLTPERTPTCLHFAKGHCSNPSCRYMHVHVSPTALNCRSFGIYGYCEKGARCAERHAHECPDFSNTGTCTTKGCKLLHRYKASIIRKNTVNTVEGGSEENSDLSSDEDDEIDSDDVDSDDLEEYLGDDDGQVDTDVPMQQDFVQLS